MRVAIWSSMSWVESHELQVAAGSHKRVDQDLFRDLCWGWRGENNGQLS